MKWVVFVNNDCEAYIAELNALHNIPQGGVNSVWIDGTQRKDGIGKTTNYAIPLRHPTDATKCSLPKDILTQDIIDEGDYEIDYDKASLLADGWIIG